MPLPRAIKHNIAFLRMVAAELRQLAKQPEIATALHRVAETLEAEAADMEKLRLDEPK